MQSGLYRFHPETRMSWSDQTIQSQWDKYPPWNIYCRRFPWETTVCLACDTFPTESGASPIIVSSASGFHCVLGSLAYNESASRERRLGIVNTGYKCCAYCRGPPIAHAMSFSLSFFRVRLQPGTGDTVVGVSPNFPSHHSSPNQNQPCFYFLLAVQTLL